MPFTLRNIKKDLEDIGPRFDGASDLEFRAATKPLALENCYEAGLASPFVFPAAQGGPLGLGNFRRRVWTPAVEASGIATPARIYDLRSTFASNALAVGVEPFELTRIMGTSMRMLERHYGTLIAGATTSIAARLDRLGTYWAREAEAGTPSDGANPHG